MEQLSIEVKFSRPDEGVIEGYASYFGGEPDSVGDVVASGAFARSLTEHKAAGTAPLMLWQHDPTEPIGVWTDIREDQNGLAVKGQLVLEAEKGREAHALLKAGALNGLSIGFRARDAECRNGGGRLLQDLQLIEISLVSIPAAPRARVTSVKSAAMGAAKERSQTMAVETKTPAPEAGKKSDAIQIAEFETRLKSVEDNLGTITKSADRIEQKLNRPGIITKSDDPASVQKKAFESYVRFGDAATGVELKNLTQAANGGGYLAPTQFVGEIVKNLVQFSAVRQYARVMTIGAAEAKMPKRTGTLTASWVGETEDRSSTESSYGEITLTPHEAACYIDVSNALLEDNMYNLEGEISGDFAEEFGRLEGAAFVSGDGVGKPAGILTDATIPQVASGAAAVIDGDALIDLYHDLPSFYAANGVWGMNRTTIGVVRKLKDADGRYLWVDPVSVGNPSTILGRPVIELPDMPDVAANSLPVLFGDLKQAYRIVDRISLSVLRDPYSRATNGQTRFHARRRVGGGVTKSEALRLLKVATAI